MSPHPSTAAPPTPRRRWSTVWLPAGVVLLVVALVASAMWAARSEAGTRWLFDRVPGLTVQGVRGSLWGDALASSERVDS